MKRALVALLLFSFAARAAEPVYEAPEAPPAALGPLLWRFQGQDVHGYWLTDAQTQRVAARISYLEDRATRECVEETNAANKRLLGMTSTTWIVGGAGLLVGLLGGAWLAHRL